MRNSHKLTRHAGGLLLAAFTFFGMLSCSHKQPEQDRQPYVIPDSLMRTLVIDTVKVSNVSYSIKFNGMVDFNTDKVVNVFPLISGVVQGVHVAPGDYVKAGQALGTVRSAEIANYNAALVNALAAERLAKKQLDQQQELYKSGLASQVDITSAQSAYQQAVAARVAAQRILNINGNNANGEYIIRAPLPGFIVQQNIANGMAIRTDNSTALFTISDLKQVWVEANVYEANIARVHEGDSVAVTTISYPDKIFHGRINKLMSVLDPASKVMKMRVVLNNPGFLLKPQMFATVTVSNKEQQRSPSVSKAALIFDHSQYYVVVIDPKKNVQIRSVEVTSTDGNTAFIKSGLKPGETVVASNAILIYGSLNS